MKPDKFSLRLNGACAAAMEQAPPIRAWKPDPIIAQLFAPVIWASAVLRKSFLGGLSVSIRVTRAVPAQPFPGLLEINHVFRIRPPAPVRQDTPAGLINGNEVIRTIHVSSFRHPQGDDGDAKCLVFKCRENFAGKVET